MSKELKILIIDDDGVDQQQIKRALAKSDILFHIKTAVNATEALKLIASEKFDCCFIDYILPGKNGIELTSDIRKLNINTPIVVITNETDPELSNKAILAGATNYLTKSLITPDGLSLIIRNSISISKVKAELRHAKETAMALAQSKQDFLADMSHEIRTPMNAILGFSELLSGTELNEKQSKYIKSVRFAADSLMRIINDILDYSKLESGKFKLEKIPVNIYELLQNIIAVEKVLADDKSLKLELDIDKKTPMFILSDSTRLNQIFFNLIGNAIKFTPSGKIMLKAELVSNSEDKKEIKFSVSDTGIGIAPDKIKSIFARYTQAEDSIARKFGGTGLGLSISYSLVELFGGKLAVDSELEKGTCFHFTLPIEIVRKKMAQ